MFTGRHLLDQTESVEEYLTEEAARLRPGQAASPEPRDQLLRKARQAEKFKGRR